jgi:5-methylthioadenosine/S-adenosylhomocysteine deaminase
MNILIDNALGILPGETRVCDVYIADGIIAAIDKAPGDFVPARVVSGHGKLLSPGFINAHTHTYMTCLRNRADDLNFMTWLFDRILPMEDKLNEEDGYWGVLLGCMEMLLSGTTAFLDMDIFKGATARALSDCGFRGVVSKGLQDIDGKARGDERIALAVREMEQYKNAPNIGFALAPHAAYTCSEDYLRLVAEKAAELNVGIHTHLSESQDEQDKTYAAFGISPAALYARAGILGERTVCAHCVYLSDEDMVLLAESGTTVAHNPASNMKLGNGFAPVSKMLKKGINVALGTDGSCSNNNQNMLREMQLASLIHKGTAKEAVEVPAAAVFDMATVNGARALGMGGQLGELRAGMRADLALFDLDYPGFFPLGDVKAALCYSSAGLRADTVLVDGRILLDKGEFTTIDAERVRFHVREITKKLD